VDASVAAKWFLPVEREPDGKLARAAIGKLPMRTTSLALYEVGNLLSRDADWGAQRVSTALGLLGEICGDPIDLTAEDYDATARLTAEHGLTFYDASYVAIARRVGRAVLSADEDLIGPGLASGLAAALGSD
jgi:predicted nucleic acid-binding protein